MLIYIVLIVFILLGQFLYSFKTISKGFYCVIIGLFMIAISGFRNSNIGMWDTTTIYLPSFDIIATHSIPEILQMDDTHFQAIGYVLYCKLLSFFYRPSILYFHDIMAIFSCSDLDDI